MRLQGVLHAKKPLKWGFFYLLHGVANLAQDVAKMIHICVIS